MRSYDTLGGSSSNTDTYRVNPLGLAMVRVMHSLVVKTVEDRTNKPAPAVADVLHRHFGPNGIVVLSEEERHTLERFTELTDRPVILEEVGANVKVLPSY